MHPLRSIGRGPINTDSPFFTKKNRQVLQPDATDQYDSSLRVDRHHAFIVNDDKNSNYCSSSSYEMKRPLSYNSLNFDNETLNPEPSTDSHVWNNRFSDGQRSPIP